MANRCILPVIRPTYVHTPVQEAVEPVVESVIEPEVQIETQPEAQPEAQPVVESVIEPVVEPEAPLDTACLLAILDSDEPTVLPADMTMASKRGRKPKTAQPEPFAS